MTDIIGKADRAKRLLNDPELKQAFQDVEDAIIRTWKESSQEDVAGHTYLKQALHILSSVTANLERAVSDGKLKAFRIEQEEKEVTFLGDIRGRLSRKSN